MSISAKNFFKITKTLRKNQSFVLGAEKRESSTEKVRKHLSLKNAFYKIEPKTKTKTDLTILDFIRNNNERILSAKTALTSSPPETIEYDLCMINKYDENLNSSLSFISDFDLEEDVKKNDSFNSCEGDAVEEIGIKTKSNKRIIDNLDDEEFNFELEKDWKDIKNFLLKNKSSQ